MHSQGAQHFYDDLAAWYDRIYPDWDASIARQAAALDVLLTTHVGAGPLDVLDCACGIGTQALGLAAAGHRVAGCDLSPVAATRAAAEARHRWLDVGVAAADMRALPFTAASFDAVVCADNSLPHLLTDADVISALAQMRRVVRPGGVVLVSTREYDALRQERPAVSPPQLSADEQGRRALTVQVWDWSGDVYVLTHLQSTEDGPGHWSQVARTVTYRAWSRGELAEHARSAGLKDVRWVMPVDSGFFQPLLLARVPVG